MGSVITSSVAVGCVTTCSVAARSAATWSAAAPPAGPGTPSGRADATPRHPARRIARGTYAATHATWSWPAWPSVFDADEISGPA